LLTAPSSVTNFYRDAEQVPPGRLCALHEPPQQGKFSCEDGRGLRWRAGALSVKNPASAVIGFRFLS
jgi:hypothetical protein